MDIYATSTENPYYTDIAGNGSATTTNLTAITDYTLTTPTLPAVSGGTITVTLTTAGFTKLATALTGTGTSGCE